MKPLRVRESLLYLSIGGQLQEAWPLVVEDEIRGEAKAMMAQLQKLGIRRILLASGDRKSVVEHVARLIGITEVHAELLPEDKLNLISRLKAEGS